MLNSVQLCFRFVATSRGEQLEKASLKDTDCRRERNLESGNSVQFGKLWPSSEQPVATTSEDAVTNF